MGSPTHEYTYDYDYDHGYDYSRKHASHPRSPLSYAREHSYSSPRSPTQCFSPARHSSNADYEYSSDASDVEPNARMPHTYAWVLEQQIAEMAALNEETVRWVHTQQQARAAAGAPAHILCLLAVATHAVSPLARSVPVSPVEPGVPPSFEELLSTRREWRAAWEPREARDVAEDELRRWQAHRRDAERCRAAYERRKRVEEEKERERTRRERELRRREKERAAAARYEARWAELLASLGSNGEVSGEDGETNARTLGFRDVPWPMVSQPRALADIREDKVAAFVLSPLYPGEMPRDKIRNALKRWHPDRFGRLWSRVRGEERELIEEGVGIVARCLSDLLERESQ